MAVALCVSRPLFVTLYKFILLCFEYIWYEPISLYLHDNHLFTLPITSHVGDEAAS